MAGRYFAAFIAAAAVAGATMSYAATEEDQRSGLQPVVEHMTQLAREAINHLDRELERCSHTARSRELVPVQLVELQSRYAREPLLTAVAHLSLRNRQQCELAARQALSYTLVTLDQLTNNSSTIAEDIASYPRRLLYPDARDIDLKLRYQQLPAALRDSLEQILGREPFDAVRAMDLVAGSNISEF